MKDCELVDIVTWINWDSVIDLLKNVEGVAVTTDSSRWNWNTNGYSEIYQMWKDANFNPSSIKWINYYPVKHYPESIILKLSNWLNVTPLRSWISRIEPGYFAPWHWDVDDQEDDYLSKGEIVRYSCFIDNPHNGHIFILGQDYIHSQKQGSLYKWSNYREWHSGINAGMNPKYMLHLLAITR